MVLQRIRGLIGVSLVWGTALSVIGTSFILIGLATGLIPSIPNVGWAEWIMMAGRVAARDFLGGCAVGAVFGLLLTGTERRRTIDTLSLSRVGGLGFLAAAVPTALLGLVSGYAIPTLTLASGAIAAGITGVGLSVGMIRLARRGALPSQSAELIG